LALHNKHIYSLII